MKLSALLLSALILLFLSSCSTVTFKQPQPQGVDGLNAFPKQLRGTFQFPKMQEGVETEQSRLIITERAAIVETVNSDSFLLEYINSDKYRLKGDTIILTYNHGTLYKSTARFRNDSVFGVWTVYDTIADLPGKGALKPLGKVHLLSIQFDDNDNWMVFVLQTTKGGVMARSIKIDNELELMHSSFPTMEVIPFKGLEDTSYVLDPTKEQLEKYISKGGFSDKALFKRVK